MRAPPINELAPRNPLKCERVDQARSSEKLRANNDSNDGDSTGDSDDDGSRGGSGGDSNKLRLEPRCRLRLRRQRLTSQRFSLRFAWLLLLGFRDPAQNDTATLNVSPFRHLTPETWATRVSVALFFPESGE